MPRTKGQSEQIREERRRAILSAAVTRFARHGFSQTTASDIARDAGVSHGSVFQYFATKDELFRAALVEPLLEAEQHFQQFHRLQGSPLDRLRQLVREQVGTFVRQTSYLRLVQYVTGQRQRFPELEGELQRFARLYSDLLAPIIREGQALGELGPGSPEAVAFSYFAYLNGVGLTISWQPEATFLEEIIQNGIRIFGPLKP